MFGGNKGSLLMENKNRQMGNGGFIKTAGSSLLEELRRS